MIFTVSVFPRGHMIWLHALLPPPPSPFSKLDRRYTGRGSKGDNLATGKGERGWEWSLVIRRQESLVRYKSFNPLWCRPAPSSRTFATHLRHASSPRTFATHLRPLFSLGGELCVHVDFRISSYRNKNGI